MSIVNRTYGDEFTSFFRSYSNSAVLTISGEGTTAREALAVLGLESTSKAILFTVVGPAIKKLLFKELKRVMHIDAPGNGIALSIPMKSITVLGIEQLAPQFYDWSNEEPTEENTEMNEYKYELIVVIANEDSTDEIMAAARAAGARGGTLVNAKGTAPAEVRKFFGVNISEGKDMVFIVAKAADRAAIMKAITDKNVGSTLKAVSFSVPIDSVAGLFSEDKE